MSRPGLLDALRLNAARTSGREHPLDAEGELARLRRLGARALLRGEPDYPAELEALEQPPLVLYALGRPAPLGLAAAVVGSRTPSRYGCRMARRLAGDLAAAGAAIVSGLARGIDAEAHEAALARGGRTWAVLGSGLARVYPPENEPLARRIADSGGLLLSEFPLEAGPRKAWFPRRNRLIAALGRAVVVVEGTEASGSLGTAELAQGLGRDVFAVPGPADSPLSAAPHKLLRDGAQLACEASDILLSFPLELRHAAKAAACVRAPAATAALSLPSDYKKIIESLAAEALTVDELAVGSGLSVSRLSNILFEMELQGLVSPAPGQRYAKKES